MVLPWLSKLIVVTTGRSTNRGGFDSSGKLLGGRQGLDPDHLGATICQCMNLFSKYLHSSLMIERTHRLEQESRWTDGPGNDHLSIARSSHLKGDLDCCTVQLDNPVPDTVKVETGSGAAERVCENDVGAGIHKPGVDLGHQVRMLDVP